jgi:hypothetical protein
MTEAQLIECIVSHEKGIHGHNDDGDRTFFAKGDKIKLTPHSAARFTRTGYVTNPKVAAAKAEVAKEEAAALEAATKAPSQPANQADPNAPKPATAAKPSGGGQRS